MFYLYIPFHGGESRVTPGFEKLEDAKLAADAQAVYGYCVCNETGKGIYSPIGSFVASHILYHAKSVADHMRLHGYKYGDADKNPALDKNSDNPEKIVSCDRFCGWVLYEAGYTAHQPVTKGLPLYFPPTLQGFLELSGFTRVDNPDEVRPGDLIFEGDSHYMAPALPEQYRDNPRHVFINAGPAKNGLYYRYDAGSDTRIQSVQPMIEQIFKPERGRPFRFAYRASETLPWDDVVTAHELCTYNREALKNSAWCGCFYCKNIYDPKEITDWLDGGKTALCPRCGIDSVIYETKKYDLTQKFLQKMYDYWF